MAKQIECNELSEIVTALLNNPELLGQGEKLEQQKLFFLDIAETVARHYGGTVNGVSDDGGKELMVSVSADDAIESLNRNVWCLHDRDGWEDDDYTHLTDLEVGEALTVDRVRLIRDRIQHSLINIGDEVDHEFVPEDARTIEFSISSGLCAQTFIPLAQDINLDDLAEGLTSGKYTTTLTHNGYKRSYITETATGRHLAIILDQDVTNNSLSAFSELG